MTDLLINSKFTNQRSKTMGEVLIGLNPDQPHDSIASEVLGFQIVRRRERTVNEILTQLGWASYFHSFMDNQQQRSKTMKDIYGKDIPLSEEDMREMSRMSVMESLADFLDIPSYLVKKIWYDNKRKVRNVYIEGRMEISRSNN